MSRLLSRLILACATVCAAPVLWFMVFFILDEAVGAISFVANAMTTTVVTGIVFVAAWLGVWSEQVVWTTARSWMTMLSLLWSGGIAALIGLLLTYVPRALRFPLLP